MGQPGLVLSAQQSNIISKRSPFQRTTAISYLDPFDVMI